MHAKSVKVIPYSALAMEAAAADQDRGAVQSSSTREFCVSKACIHI